MKLSAGHTPKRVIARAPGRINIIGEHTDYNDGFVLPGAIDKTLEVEMYQNGTATEVHILDKAKQVPLTFDLGAFRPQPAPGWQNYVMGVVHELQKLNPGIRGFDAVFEGDVPIGSGMSSSASLECSFAVALNALFDLGLEPFQIIRACQRAEHNFVGIKCGIMDQFASVMGKKDHVMLLDTRSLEHTYFPLDLGPYRILLLNTNVSHTLASSQYNKRRSECEEGVAILKTVVPDATSLRDVTLKDLDACKTRMPEHIFRRCRHVISENRRVLKATEALTAGRLQELGQLLYASHASLRDDYAVSCAELDFLVGKARDRGDVPGSRMMGGGFGGCTISIVDKSRAGNFVEEISDAYRHRFGIDLTPYDVAIEDGAHVLAPRTRSGQ